MLASLRATGRRPHAATCCRCIVGLLSSAAPPTLLRSLSTPTNHELTAGRTAAAASFAPPERQQESARQYNSRRMRGSVGAGPAAAPLFAAQPPLGRSGSSRSLNAEILACQSVSQV